ncbi:MAG: hypothetical protein ACUZ8H_02100 [Candidatus Anammoxibacter sp.]
MNENENNGLPNEPEMPESPESLRDPQGACFFDKDGILKLPTIEQQLSDLCNYMANLYKCISFIAQHQEIIYESLDYIKENLKTINEKQNRFMK